MPAWTFTLAVDLPSANRHVINGKHAATAARYRQLRDRLAAAIRIEMVQLGIPSCNRAGEAPDRPADAPFRQVVLVRLWAKGCRAWDDDNWVAAAKLLRDACQRERIVRRGGLLPRLVPGAGLVWDDSARWSSWSYAQERSHDGKPRVKVTVVEGGYNGER